MKYIVTTQPDGTEEIFLFPNEINHDCMAEALARIRNKTHGDWERIDRKPIAAGFVSYGLDWCYGESETLRLKSRGEADTKLLTL